MWFKIHNENQIKVRGIKLKYNIVSFLFYM